MLSRRGPPPLLTLLCFVGVIFSLASVVPVLAGSRGGIGISIGSSGTRTQSLLRLFDGPIIDARELETIARRIEKDRERFLEEAERAGELDKAPPTESFPGWARCQEIALKARPEMLLVRMNLQGMKAAIDLLRGNRDQDYDDSIGREFPSGFDARDWGQEILARLGTCARNRESLKRLLSRETAAMRCLFGDLRDGINRDVVFAHHSWERAGRDAPSPGMANPALSSGAASLSAMISRRRAAWKLWHVMGCPR